MRWKNLSFNRYTATAGLFIACIVFLFFANLTTTPRSVYNNLIGTKEKTIPNLIKSFQTGYSDGFFKKQLFINLYGGTQRLLQKNVIGNFDVIRDNQGSLHLAIDFNKITYFNPKLLLDVKDSAGTIPLLYLHTGNKILENFTSFQPGLTSYKLENSDYTIASVKELGVDVIDVREWFKRDKVDYSKLFFITDHHWRIETAFYTYKNLLTFFEEDYLLTFPNKDQIVNDDNFEFITYDNFFLGSSGRRVGQWYAGMDDFTLILPAFDTNYTAYDYDRFGTPLDGNFRDVIIYEERLSNKALETNRYTSYLFADCAKRTFVNHNGKNNILIIEDSYGLPLSSFLSLAFHELTIIDFRLFRGSMDEVIQEGDFDIILFINQVQYP